jgi:hypothetical protein
VKCILDPEKMDSTSIYKIIAGAIMPRPIGFISTISADNVRNAAPFRFFNGISDVPPLRVGTEVTPRSPHRSHRAELPQRVPQADSPRGPSVGNAGSQKGMTV